MLDGQVAIVTGGASGIGRACCLRFAEEGASVVVVDLNEDGAKETAAQVEKRGSFALVATGDVSQRSRVDEILGEAAQRFGRADILVHSAGILRDFTVSKMSQENWDAVLGVHLKGAIHFTDAVVPFMCEREYGKITYIASRAHLGNFGQTNYSTAKSAMAGLAKATAIKYGPNNITANVVAPGIVDTPMMQGAAGAANLNARAKVAPLRRAGTPDEVASAVLFFSSPMSSFVTGQVMNVCGGRSLLPATQV